MSSSFPGPLWEVVAPQGGTASVSNQHLFLNVPGGSNHDALHPSNQAVRVVQPIGDQSFDVSIKIDSPVVATDAGTSQGLMVLADDENFITFALVTNGTNLGLSVQTVTEGWRPRSSKRPVSMNIKTPCICGLPGPVSRI